MSTPFGFVPVDRRRTQAKPRQTGMSMVIDDGLPLAYVESVLEIAAPYIDLMKIADPDKRARKPLTEGALAFPFWTIENVDVVDPEHIVVGNDNNLPFSTSREPNKADDNEFVLLRVDEFLKAR